MIFSIPQEFLCSVFLDVCAANGVMLQKTGDQEPDGFIVIKNGELQVILSEPNETNGGVVIAAVEAQGGSLK